MPKLSYQWKLRLYFLILMASLQLLLKSPFNFMVLNVFLAYLPIEFGFWVQHFADRRSLAFWSLLFLWLIFYPNAPYVMTDLFHFSWLHPHTSTTGILRTDPKMWLIFALMVLSAFSCVIFGTVEMARLSRLLEKMLTPKLSHSHLIWVGCFSFLAGIGIYIGRFLRLHSIYLFITPSWFFNQLLSIWSWPMLEFVLIMTILQLLLYWCLHLIKQTDLM